MSKMFLSLHILDQLYVHIISLWYDILNYYNKINKKVINTLTFVHIISNNNW